MVGAKFKNIFKIQVLNHMQVLLVRFLYTYSDLTSKAHNFWSTLIAQGLLWLS